MRSAFPGVTVFASAVLALLALLHDARASAPPALPLDVGESWIPPLFRQDDSSFAATYIALAQERFDDVPEDLRERAARDRYLEVFGIPPTLKVLRQRMRDVRSRACRIDETIAAFAERTPGASGLGALREEDEIAAEQWLLLHEVERTRSGETAHAAPLSRHRRQLVERLDQWRRGLQAVRLRLACEGFLRGAIPETPQLDWKTSASIAEFARRHRIYARGELSSEVLEALQLAPEELERRALLRVLAERARVGWGVLEDETAEGVDLLRRLETHLEGALQLHTPEDAERFLESLGDIPEHRLIPIECFVLPDDYGPHMELRVVIDRGDVLYDPPFDEEGRRIRRSTVDQGPTLEVIAGTGASARRLVRWPTTIGGWRQERAGDEVVWSYKASPVGRGYWERIIAAPVWLPPASTPSSSLVHENTEGVERIKRTLLGPGYASAYGLVAALHRRRVGPRSVDEGIRTHGSVDYTSVFGDFSHGCHRLQNHRAVALFSFLLAHRAHRYDGPVDVEYRRQLQVNGESETLTIDRRGDRFVLTPPVPFEVLRGTIVGERDTPPEEAFPVRAEDAE